MRQAIHNLFLYLFAPVLLLGAYYFTLTGSWKAIPFILACLLWYRAARHKFHVREGMP